LQIEHFLTLSYYGPDHGESWPAPPRTCEPEHARVTFERGVEQCEAAHQAGFDSLNFAEHHYTPKMLSPDPLIYAAVVGRHIPDTQIGLFGTNLPINNPVRIAEQYAMLDNLLGGRLRIGMLRGTPNEYMTYGTNPWESRERFEEAVLLLMRCFSEPEPFGWEGRHFRFRNIAIWPRSVQQPHPRILISGNSRDGAMFAGLHRLDLGFSYMAPDKCAANLTAYREAAAEAGWEPTADNVQYRQFLYVDEDDDAARAVQQQYQGGGLLALFQGASMDMMGVMGMVGAGMGGAPKGFVPPPGAAPPLVPWPALVGSPDTVLARIREARDGFEFGRLEVSIGVGVLPVPHELAMQSIKLLGETVIPALHEERF
jgi:alkanesulfonate monooxygenase SsuD/methylene tetrahydromethanopterin reductase-like flavin-dependent oxidoreductase (luciferase family)